MKTHRTKESQVHRAWHLVDAQAKPLGRLASEVARLLSGKQKPSYEPFLDTGDFVVVINAEKVHVHDRKRRQKVYHRHSGYPGGLKSIPFEVMMAKKPQEVIRMAVRGMLPKNRLGRQMIRKLKVYAGSVHPHEAQRPAPLPH